ncbi:hypothetical protein DR66_3734 [Delftia acidovorans]|nr:hypothetical protein DR66_3734 [Delftia acidovorans]
MKYSIIPAIKNKFDIFTSFFSNFVAPIFYIQIISNSLIKPLLIKQRISQIKNNGGPDFSLQTNIKSFF